MITRYHARYYAAMLSQKSVGGELDSLSQSLLSSTVDINPHQIDAALFAFRSPLSKGVVLADEVGLGKTIEAGLVLCQYWSTGKRKIIKESRIPSPIQISIIASVLRTNVSNHPILSVD